MFYSSVTFVGEKLKMKGEMADQKDGFAPSFFQNVR
jgi:hypothetical protein